MKKRFYSFAKRNAVHLAALNGMTITRTEYLSRLVAQDGLAEMLRRNRNPSEEEAEFLDFCLDNSRGSHSQYQQDLFALWHTRSARAGVFVEFGAADGTMHSNTKMLERDFGWTGILIEPHPDFYKIAKRMRKGSKVINGAVDPLYRAEGGHLSLVIAGQLSSIAGYHNNDKHAESRSGLPTTKVPYINLNRTLIQNIPDGKIDFMSIDTEGSELDIIKGFDFLQFDVSCICIEVNDRDRDAEKITEILLNNNYRRAFSREITRDDLWFIKNT